MNRRSIIIAVAFLISTLGIPLTLHELDLRHIRDTTFSAIRFAAIADPSQLSQLPVSHWEETEGVVPPDVRHLGWGQYQMKIPRTTTTVMADVDLRPTLTSLLLGGGGWLRVIGCIIVGGGLLLFGMKRTTSRIKKNLTPSLATPTSTPGTRHTQIPISLFNAGLDRVTHPGVVLDQDYRLVAWNSAIQNDSPDITWSHDLHLLDLATLLPWGKSLIEAVDDHALRTDSETTSLLLIIKEGDRICVTAG